MLRMCRIGDGVAQCLVAGDTAAIFRRPGILAVGADGIGVRPGSGFRLLDQDDVPPAVTEIVLVDEAQPDRRRNLRQGDFFLIEVAQIAHHGRVGVAHVADRELVEVIALPAERDLDDPVQLAERALRWDEQAAPDRRRGPLDRDLELSERRRALGGHGAPYPQSSWPLCGQSSSCPTICL